MSDSYCKVYLDSGLGTTEIKTLVRSIVGGSIDGRTVDVDGVHFDVFENRPFGRTLSLDDFVRWPFYLEIEPSGDNAGKADEFVSLIVLLLVGLRENGVRAVASCDFEERLAVAMR